MDLTFFEIHLHGDALPTNAPFGGSRSEEATSEDAEAVPVEGTEEGGGGGSAVGAIVSLLFLIGVAYAVRRYLGGGDEPGEPIATEEADAGPESVPTPGAE